MYEAKKHNRSLIGCCLIIFLLTFFLGFGLGRGRVNSKVADAQATIDELTSTVTGLNQTIAATNIEYERLTRIYERDRERIVEIEANYNELEQTNRRAAELIEKQKQLIDNITREDYQVGEYSNDIARGLNEAISTVDSIIEDIQNREN